MSIPRRQFIKNAAWVGMGFAIPAVSRSFAEMSKADTAVKIGADTASAPPQKASKRPNIIFFLVDDMGWQDTSVEFHPQRSHLQSLYRTPNMERLAASGVKFTNAYSQAVCTPTRCSIMTGMNSARSRITNWTRWLDTPTDVKLDGFTPPAWNVNAIQPYGHPDSASIGHSVQVVALPRLLKEGGGYHTIHCGKAHLGTHRTPGSEPLNFGFDVNISGCELGAPGSYLAKDAYGKSSKHPIPTKPYLEKYLEKYAATGKDTFLTTALTCEAIAALDRWREGSEAAAGNPFFLNMSHYAVHLPLMFDHEYEAIYLTEGEINTDNKKYCTMVQGMDASLGALLDWLDEHDLAKETIIVFTSDNGGYAGTQRGSDVNFPAAYGKGSSRDGALRVPFLARVPGISQPNTTCPVPIHCDDIFPTLLSLARVPWQGKLAPDQIVDGSDVSQLYCSQTAPAALAVRPLLFHYPNVSSVLRTEHYRPHTALRLGDWKLVYRHDNQQLFLFNLAEDVGESNDLSADPKYADKLQEMTTTMTAQLHHTQAQMPTSGGVTIPYPSQQ